MIAVELFKIAVGVLLVASYLLVVTEATRILFHKLTDSLVGQRVPDDVVAGAAIAALLGGLLGPFWLPWVRRPRT